MIETDLHSPTHTTITRRIHRGHQGSSSWWNTSTVCDLPGSYGPGDLVSVVALLPAIRRMGFDGLMLRLATFDMSAQRLYVARLVKAAHAANLRIIVRLSPGPDTAETAGSEPLVELRANSKTLGERTRMLLDGGVDGVDLGLIKDDPDLPDPKGRAGTFTTTVNQQLAEVASLDSTVILTAEASTANESFFEHHVREDWFHHLRDDSLLRSPWDARELTDRICQTYATRDPLGQTVAWRPARATRQNPFDEEQVADVAAWYQEASTQRINAFTVYAGSLPGALYLPFTYAGGQAEQKENPNSGMRVHFASDPGSRYQHDLTTRMLNLRQQKGMARAGFALIERLTWAGSDVAVHLTGHTMVVLNTSTKPVRVPARHVPLLYSDGFVFNDGDSTVVQPDTCAWFDPAPARTHDPGRPTL